MFIYGDVMEEIYRLNLKGLDCANCAAKIEERINNLEMVVKANVDFMSQSCSFSCEKKHFDESVKNIKKIIKEIEPDVEVSFDLAEEKKDNTALYKIGIGFILIVLSFLAGNTLFKHVFLIISYIVLGYDVLIKAIRNIFKGDLFDENFLMSIATIAAFFIGEYFEASIVMLLYQIGEIFQDKAVETSRSNIAKLIGEKVTVAKVIRGEEVTIPVEEVKLNEIIVVRAGEKIPLDGVIVEGETSLDTSSLTGESFYKDSTVKDEVFSGYINLSGTIKVKVMKLYNESMINKILDLVENSGSRKADTEKFITRFARVYTPIVVIMAAVLALVLPLITDLTLIDSIERACILLIVSCPCALVISIPLGFFSGIGGLSKNGVLVKGGIILDSLSKVNTIAFDKTGTLTQGDFYVEEVVGDETLMLAAHAEINSNHPIAKSIVNSYKDSIYINKIKGIKELAGLGIICTFDGNQILVGNRSLLRKNNVEFTDVDKNAIFVAKNNTFVGYIVLKDKLKNNSRQAVSDLRMLGINNLMIISGDDENVVKEVGNELGINNVYGNMFPDNKLEFVKETMKDNHVAFVGDGINDAPTLAVSDVGIAMGGLGSDASIEAADVIVMDDSLVKIPRAIAYAKKTMNIIKTNIVFAIGVKILVILLGVFGIANMYLAIFADVGVSVLCILNSIRLLRVSKSIG